MRVKAITTFSLIPIFSLLICYSAFSASIFTVVGTVRNADDTLAADGLEVVVSNETKKLTVTTTLGKEETGLYGVVFIDMENKAVAALGDVLKVTVKDAQDILDSQTYEITADDMTTSLAIVDVKFGTSPPPVAPTEMEVGALNIKAKDIHQESGSRWIASGDVSINDFLLFSGDLEIDKARLEVSGSGTIYLTQVPYLGDKIALFAATEFSFDGNLATLAEQVGLQTKLTVGFLEYSLDTLKLIPDGVTIGGSIALPEGTSAMLDGRPSGVAEADLSITKTKGLELLAGKIEISNLRLGSTGFTLENLYLQYRKEDNYFEGGCAVYIPRYFSIEAAVGVKQGQLSKVGIGVDKLNQPILTTPVGPIVFLQRIYGELDELAPEPPPIILRAETAITGGPQIGNNFVIRADLSITIDTSGELIGRGDIFLISEDGRLGGAELGISVHKGLWIQGDINILDILIASGKVSLDLQNQLQGKFRGALVCPDEWYWWPIRGKEFADVWGYFDNTRIGVSVKVSFFEVGVLYDEDGFHVPANLNEIKEIVGAAPKLTSGKRILMAPNQTTVNLPTNTPFALFRLTWTEGDTDIELLSPSGKRLSRNDALAEPDLYFYQKDMERNEITFAVNQPEPGGWQVIIPNVLEIGEYRLQIFGGNVTPKLLLGAMTIDQAGMTATINWQDKDDDDNANISLYYDTDAEGFDGALMVDNISEDDELDSFQWDFSDAPSGTYYIYGKIDDGVNMPVFSYSSTPVIVQNIQAPLPPTELNGIIEDDNIKLNWNESPSGEAVEGYVVYWTDKPRQPGYPHRLAVGNQTEYTLEELEPGRTYRIAVVAYDERAKESGYSELIEIPLQTITVNNPPQIVSLPVTEGQVGKIYSYNVDAEDYDEDVLSYSLKVAPKGAEINADSGVITWTPAENQAGNNSFAVLVSDNAGGEDEQAFTVIVANVNRNPEAFIVSPPTDKSISGEYLIRWQASDKDKDELTVELYYSEDEGKTYVQFASGLANTGEYLWNTTTVSDGTYKLGITVRDAQSSTTDYTEGVFTINNELLPLDVNNDGVIDIADFVLVGKHFGETGEGIVGDVNNDGVVDMVDLMLVGSHFGE